MITPFSIITLNLRGGQCNSPLNFCFRAFFLDRRHFLFLVSASFLPFLSFLLCPYSSNIKAHIVKIVIQDISNQTQATHTMSRITIHLFQLSLTLKGPTRIYYPRPNSKPTHLIPRPIPDLGWWNLLHRTRIKSLKQCPWSCRNGVHLVCCCLSQTHQRASSRWKSRGMPWNRGASQFILNYRPL